MFFLQYFSLRHPGHLLFYTLSLACGIILQWWCQIPYFAVLLIVGSLILVQIFYYAYKKTWLPYGFYAVAFCAGQYVYQKQFDAHQLLFLLAQEKPATIVGRLVDATKLEGQQARYSLTIKTQSVLVQGTTDPITIEKSLLVYTTHYPKNLLVGDLIYLPEIKIKKPANASFDFYLMKENIACSTFITAQSLQLIERPSTSFARWLYYYKHRILARCKEKLPPQTFALFASIFLGNRTFYKKSMEAPKEDCKAWGLSHYLARSGLHMVIFIFAWDYLLNLLPIAFIIKQLLLVFISLFYFLLSWSNISFIRALISFIFYKMCIMLKISGHFLHLLTLTCFVVLVINPAQLFFLDFQLSFGLTFALAWFNHMKQLNKTQNII